MDTFFNSAAFHWLQVAVVFLTLFTLPFQCLDVYKAYFKGKLTLIKPVFLIVLGIAVMFLNLNEAIAFVGRNMGIVLGIAFLLYYVGITSFFRESSRTMLFEDID